MTLISIIGSFDTTLLNLVNEFAPELKRVILIFDDTTGSAKNLERHQNALERFKKRHGYKYAIDSATIIDEDNATKLDTILHLASAHDRVMIDISDALGSTSAYLGARAVSDNISLIAFNSLENEYNVISTSGFDNKRLTRTLTIQDYVESLGYSLVEKRGQPPRPKKDVLYLFQQFASFQNARYTLIKSSHIPFNRDLELHQILHRIGVIDESGHLIDRNYLQGGLFEEYIYWIATEMGFDDLLSSAEIRFAGDSTQGTLINNEFDLLAFKNNRLYLFECKFTKSFDLDDLIYKYMALKEHIKNDSKGIIITVNPKMSPNIQTADINKIPSKLRKKAALFDIHVLANIIQYDHLKKELNAIIHPQGNKAIEPLKTPQKPKTYVYFLGGYDLEMFEIRKILEAKNAKFIDNTLKWGAKSSDYQPQIDALSSDEIPVFIELEIDYKPSREFEIIDHHGDYAHRKTAIEQIAQRFDIKLDRFQTLVGINDKSHIRGLRKYGISEKEISLIRHLDRQKQGVTEEDEIFAKTSLMNVKKINNIPIIETNANHFSPIADRVNYSNYIIYSQTKLSLYTQKIKSAKSFFDPYIKNNQAYYGGDKQMFFCIKEGVLSSSDIYNLAIKLTTNL
jgi:hypothetical protein